MQAISIRQISRLMPLVSTLAGVVLCVHLGNWQAAKASAKAKESAAFAARAQAAPQALTARLQDPADLQGAPVVVRGHYLIDQQVFLDNQQDHGRAGVHVIAPLRIEGSNVLVLVNRGWAPWGQSRVELPQVPAPKGEVVVTGSAVQPVFKKPFLMPDREDANPRIWNQINLARYAANTGAPVQPMVILQNQADASDGLVRDWPPPEDRVAMHRSYAWQWYAIATVLLLFFCGTRWRKRNTA